MKRIKSVNGYTIYQAATQRDADNYNCEIGSYNIYVSQDIKDYGLSNSYPEYDNIDSLTAALNICRDSMFAIACALADELSDSTIQDMDLCLEIERRLESGDSVEYVRDCYDPETGCLYSEPSKNPSYCTWLDSVRDQYIADCHAEDDDLPDDDDQDGDLEDVLEEALSAGERADQNLDYDYEETELLARAMCAAGYGYLGLDRTGELCFTDDNLQNIHFANWPEVRAWLEGVVFDDPAVSDAVERILHPEHFAAAPKPERLSHASYYVIETCDAECRWLTCTVNRPAEYTDNQYRALFFWRMAERVAFSDCGDDCLDEIVFDGERVEYVGWQPGMLIEFRSCETGEIVYSESFPQWDH